MLDIDAVPSTYEEAIQVLAVAHADGIGAIRFFVVPDPSAQVVRMIEVSDEFPEAVVERTSAGIVEWVVPVFPMNPSKDFAFRSEVAQVTRAEWDALRTGHLRLNRQWGDLSAAREVDVGK